MVKPCPGCGATTVPEARFCRLCGTPLKVGGGREDEAPISPKAQTIPLTGEARSTDGLGQDEPRRPAPHTSRVGRAEMENLLRNASAPVNVKPSGDGDAEKNGAQTTALDSGKGAADSAPAAAENASASSSTSSKRRWQAAAIVLLCVALVAVLLAFVLSRRSAPTAEDGSSPISISDQQQLVAEKLAEAETLLASGEFNRAITVLRAAAKLDPSNAEVRVRLGNALERMGERGEAIKEYAAATEDDPKNISAWSSLASAQFEEKLYEDAAESYRRLIAVPTEHSAEPETLLAYADALRLAGHAEEARAVYQKLSSVMGAQAVGQTARQRLAELGPAPSPAPPAVAGNAGQQRAPAQEKTEQVIPEVELPPPASLPTPLAAATPVATTVGAPNAETRVDYDSYYFQAVNIVNGRDPKQIARAELLHALALFQKAALGGTHRGEAQRYADRLGKEYDRRRKI
ncbi:MAG TPA: tetratricopeptide repeat protein [Pyrinomonadaceae bacterium]